MNVLVFALSAFTIANSLLATTAFSHGVSTGSKVSHQDPSLYEQRVELSANMRKELASDRIFDARGHIEKFVRQILLEFKMHGGLHIINTGLDSRAQLIEIMPKLGFSKERAFNFGGRASAKTQKKWLLKNSLRNLDFYPPNLWLLPNKEVMYYKFFPREVLFFYEKNSSPEKGGRHFLHHTKTVEQLINTQEGGSELLDMIKAHGLSIEVGYLDRNHPLAKNNFLMSWQELTGQEEIDTAVLALKSKDLEYDQVWTKKESTRDSDKAYYTLMTRVVSKGFHWVDEERYLNLPRLALSGPKLRNGYRRYLLGNGQELTEEQKNILMHAYEGSRQGSDTSSGDIYLLDNRVVAHSREAFDTEGNDRTLLVAMAGIDFSEDVAEITKKNFIDEKEIPVKALNTFQSADTLPSNSFNVTPSQPFRYSTPLPHTQYQESFSMRVFDLKGRSLTDPDILKAIRKEFGLYGALLVRNNHEFIDDLPMDVLQGLGFHEKEQFQWGGKKSGRTIRKSLGGGFHTVDFYPSKYTLLAHNEIFYQRVLPERLLFHYRKLGDKDLGGRTFVHSATNFEKLLLETPSGQDLVQKLRTHGQLIRTGFLDKNHPNFSSFKARSWQDRFATNNIEEALRVANTSREHFDFAYIKELPPRGDEGKPTYMLMTEVTVPLFKVDLKDHRSYMMFPRIPMTGPKLENGYREFLIGNGEDYSIEETELLLHAIWATREGFYQEPGDILLVNNIRYGHSREPYQPYDRKGETTIREAGVIMAGEFHTDDLK